MKMEKLLMLLFYTATWAVSVSEGFNIDVINPERFSGSEEDFFGYQVLQYQSDTNKQIIVSAPLRKGRDESTSGAIYKCTPNTGECSLLYQQDSEGRFLGMSLAARSIPSPGLASCSPSIYRDCGRNSYLSGVCYQFNSSLHTIANNTVAFEECIIKHMVNLVFVFDGSSSMKEAEFRMNKEFIWEIIQQLKNTSIHFAAVQFSSDVRTVFTFKDYMENKAKKKLDDEQHMQSLTNTHRAIDFVLENHFNNVDPEAVKALIIITDGSPTDFNTKNTIKRCEDQHITRFVIGVGEKVKERDVLEKLKSFASDPKENNTFYIQDYAGLGGLLDNLQYKIYKIEGQSVGRSIQSELSQSGFSAVYNKDALVLGAVGSNDWRGLLYEVTGSGEGAREMEIKDSNLNNDCYMGYSVAVGQRGGISLLLSGAPRSDHKGLVTLFSKQNQTWNVTTHVTSKQIGSYFGASLCVLDIDSDGDSDFAVVGAPLYYQTHPLREGRMFIYSFTSEMMLEKEMEVAESAKGQFAASVACLADLNGDNLQDIAVGAPLEDDGKGAIYIYLGNNTQGIRPQFSQRIPAQAFAQQLKQFGVAINGLMDMEGDGLPDIVVGARGTVLLLKTRPVVSVSAQFSFSPSEISIDHFDCHLQTETTSAVITLEICFKLEENTNTTVAVSSGLNVSYEFSADTVRHWSRAFFNPEDKNSRSVLKSVLLNQNDSCFNQSLYIMNCVKDTLSPVLILLNFSVAREQPSSSGAVLNIDSRTTAYVEVPFQRNCHNKTHCVADLELDFNFMNNTLLVVDQSYFIITVSLLNKGDDSYNTSVVLHYPPGLSFSKFNTIKATRRTLSSCGDQDDGIFDKTTCTISLPVYYKDTNATFQSMFRVSRFYNWSDTMEMTLVASSGNSSNFTNGIVRKSLPVQFGVDVAVRLVPEQTITYLNFSLEDKGPKPVVIFYMVRNLGVKGLPVTVNFTMPSQISHNFILEHHKITLSQTMTQCSIRKETNHTENVMFECAFFFLEAESDVQFELNALLTFLNPHHYTGIWFFHEFRLEEVFSTSAQLDFDRSRYNQMSNCPEDDANRFHKAQVSVRAELVILPNRTLVMSLGVEGGLLLLFFISILLWKSGFFKSKKYDIHVDRQDRTTEQVKVVSITNLKID